MNKARKFSMFVVMTGMALSFAAAVNAQTATATTKKTATKPATTTAMVPSSTTKTSASDEFFVVSSVEKSNLVLLRATETTATMAVTDKTQIVDETGKAIKLSDLRTGDTVFVTYATAAGGVLTATKVRKGMMTVAELRKRYEPMLPPTAGQTGPGH